MSDTAIAAPPGLEVLVAVVEEHAAVPVFEHLDGTVSLGDIVVWPHAPDLTDVPAAVCVPSDPWIAPNSALCGGVLVSWDVYLVAGRWEQGDSIAWIAAAYSSLIGPLGRAGFTVDTLTAPARFDAGQQEHLGARFAVATPA